MEKNIDHKIEGIHLYININNLNAMIKKEEKNKQDLTRIFYAMDGYLSTIEYFLKKYGDYAYVEKLTSSRIHIVFLRSCDMIKQFIETVFFSFKLAIYMNKSINKLNSLDMFQIGMGADYGNFINYEFVDQEKNISELTSIGYPANKAAKLQALADNGELIVSENLALLIKKWRPIFVFNNLNNEKTNKIIKKYKDLKGYSFPYNVYFNDDNFIKRNNLFSFEEKDDSIQKLKDKLSVNFQDIGFTDSNNQIDFSNISLKQSKRIQGSVLYADIRGFTKKFKEDGSNLPQMSVLTKKVLQRMYKCVIDYNGVHIQFQGDCESGIDNDYGNREIDYALECIFSGMSILDNIEKVNQEKEIQEGLDYQKIAVGIGCSIGTIYATRIGVRNQKDNLILGETVHEADIAEDEEAQENELVITTEFYNHLVTDIQDSKIANIIKQIFKLRNNYYYTKIGMKKYRELLNTDYVDKNSEDARKNGHLKPWSY